jgi:tetratricopeptide (TPR) repeat protein
LFDELLKRKLFKLFEKNAVEFEEILKDKRGIGVNQILSKFYFDTDKYNYNVINKTFAGKVMTEDNIELINKRGQHLILYFMMQIIKQNMTLFTYKFNYDVDIEDNFLIDFSNNINFIEILKYLSNKSSDSDYSKIADTYKHLYLMFSDFENEKHYFDYKKSFLQNSKIFNNSETQFLSARLVQYCLSKNRIAGLSSKYDKELFNIYNLIVENGYYKVSFNDFFSVQLFRNIVLLGLRLKKYKWVEVFLEKYRSRLHPKQRKNMYNYCYAKLYFERGMYRKALIYFNKIELTSSDFKNDIKSMMLKTYYELNLIENVLTLIDSYKHFLKTNKTLSPERKSAFRSFINITHKLLDAKMNGKKSMITYIENRLKAKENVESRVWLLEKVAELKHGYKAVV